MIEAADGGPRFRLLTLTRSPRLASGGPDPRDCLRFSKQLAVLIYLCARPEPRATREELIGLLWQGSSPADARQALRQVVYQVRHTTAPELLTGDQVLLLCKDCLEFDVDRFRRLLAAGCLTEALGVYEADFLPTVGLSGAREFEHWAEGLRQQLAAERRQLLRTLTSRAADAGEWSAATRYAEHLIACDPYDVEPRLQLVELLARSGDDVRASAAAVETRRIVSELSDPSLVAQLRSRLDRALSQEQAPERRRPGGFPRHPDMVARASEFGAVVERWKRALQGHGGAVLLTGELGIGKTRLAQELEQRFHQDRAVVLKAACYEIEQSDPFAPFLEALRGAHWVPGLAGAARPCLEVLAALLPEVATRFASTVTPHPLPIAREALVTALLDAFLAIAHENPTVLIVEDIHWAADRTLEFAHRLARHAPTARLFIVLTGRDYSGAEQQSRALASSGAVREVSLRSLDAADVEQLLSSIARLTEEVRRAELAPRLAQVAGGVPLYVLETLKSLHDAGDLKVKAGTWVISDRLARPDLPLPVAQAVDQVLRNRLRALGGSAFHVLTALAIEGRATGVHELARITQLDPADVEAALVGLEQRRLTGRKDGLPIIGHEELGATALALAPPGLVASFRARAGDMAEERARQGHTGEWAVAARHAAHAGDPERVIARAAQAAEAAERRSGPEGAREVLRNIVKDLEPDVRHAAEDELGPVLRGTWTVARWRDERSGRGRRRRRWVAVAVAASSVLLTASAAVLVPLVITPSRGPDATLLLITRPAAGSGERQLELPLRRDRWTYEARTLTPRRTRLPAPVLAAVRDRADLSFSPAANAWVYSRVSQDSGGLDLYMVRRGEPEQRLTDEAGDDGYPRWAPDGRQMVFVTSRWHPERRYDLAVLGLPTRMITRLTATDANEGGHSWSPDGTRILFVRRALGEGADSLCWTTLDGLSGRCFGLPGYGGLGATSWYDSGNVLIVAHSAGQQLLLRVDLDRALPEVVDRFSGGLSLSHGGQWAACLCTRAGYPERALLIYPTDRPTLAKPLALPGEPAVLPLAWLAPHSDSRYLERIEVPVPDGRIPMEATYRLSARGYDPTGRPVTLPPVLSWRSGDTAIATVDPHGVVRPRTRGTVTLYANAGGWRSDSVRVTVESTGSRTLLAEDWSWDLERRWIPYGDPLPELTAEPQEEKAFWNHGDGEFASGAYSSQAFPARLGLGVEATVSTPVTWSQWQFMVVRLTSSLDSSALATWDHRSGALPDRGAASHLGSCSFKAPDSEASIRSPGVELAAGSMIQTVPAEARLQTGAWYRMRLQIFPDGTCGLALDGLPVARVQGKLSPADRYRLVMEGQSVRTKMLVRRLEVWEGIRGDLDWSLLDALGFTSRLSAPSVRP